MGLLRNIAKRLRWQTQIDNRTTMHPTGRDTFEYVENGDHRMEIFIELMGRGKPGRILHANSIRKWHPPHDQEPITPEHKTQILSNIRKFLDNNRIDYGVKGEDAE